VSDFSDLTSLYTHLEENAINYRYQHQIANLFSRLQEKMRLQQRNDLETKAEWENKFFFFSLTATVAHPFRKKTDEKGNLVTYPSFDSFPTEAYNYLEERMVSTTNPLLKARYAHILWLSPKKHGKYAETAIDAYLKLIILYEQKDREFPNNHYGLDVLRSLMSAWSLSRLINDKNRTNIVKKEVFRLLFSYNLASSSLFKLRADLIELMVKEKTIFSKKDFEGVIDLCFDFSKTLGDSHQSITILALGQTVDKRLGSVSYDWEQLIAEVYEKMMLAHLDKDKHVAMHFCMDALNHYRKAKNTKKVGELEKIYGDLKGSLEFSKIEFKLDMAEYIKSCEKKSKRNSAVFFRADLVSFNG
jgi:hypothetical protein